MCQHRIPKIWAISQETLTRKTSHKENQHVVCTQWGDDKTNRYTISTREKKSHQRHNLEYSINS